MRKHARPQRGGVTRGMVTHPYALLLIENDGAVQANQWTLWILGRAKGAADHRRIRRENPPKPTRVRALYRTPPLSQNDFHQRHTR